MRETRTATATRHLVAVHDLDEAAVRGHFADADLIAALDPAEARRLLVGRLLAVLFFQPSTRTRIGFEAAALRLGATVSGFADPSTSRSVDYIGESLEDTVAVVSELADVLVLRHFVAGAGRRAAAVSACPVVNGGDGSNEHPTQALSDTWVMTRRLGDLRGAVVGIVGDPGTRVLRSLVLTLALLRVGKILFLVPPAAPLRTGPGTGVLHTTLPADLAAALRASGTAHDFCGDVLDLLAECDAVEMMPVDVPGLEADPASLAKKAAITPEQYRITAEKIRRTSSRALILHPGPRNDELHPGVDALPGGLYLDQVRESLHLRMAVLARLCGAL
ncbi:hypothetical protein ACFYVL_36220 [Streptomyces sp. NPDC004111]|uniref:hypothetical protein n=1 Tax=Streptomyces sp. NPDC004111 TaxID=3364690 RepID=UPI0036AD4F38